MNPSSLTEGNFSDFSLLLSAGLSNALSGLCSTHPDLSNGSAGCQVAFSAALARVSSADVPWTMIFEPPSETSSRRPNFKDVNLEGRLGSFWSASSSRFILTISSTDLTASRATDSDFSAGFACSATLSDGCRVSSSGMVQFPITCRNEPILPLRLADKGY